MDNNELESRQLIRLAHSSRQRQDWHEVVRLSDEQQRQRYSADVAGIARSCRQAAIAPSARTTLHCEPALWGLTIDWLPPPLKFALLRFGAILFERVAT